MGIIIKVIVELTFTECLLCANYCAKGFTYIITILSQHSEVGITVVLIFKCGKGGFWLLSRSTCRRCISEMNPKDLVSRQC